MWALFSSRLRTWLLFAVAVPLAGVVARTIARRIERRNGPTRGSRALLAFTNLARRRGRGRRDISAGGQAEVMSDRAVGSE